MANQEAQAFVLDEDDRRAIQDMLLDAIKAKSELITLRRNVESAARDGLPAAMLVSAGMMPRPVDLDITATAEMVQVLNCLSPATRS